jgi:hypothetical protein
VRAFDCDDSLDVERGGADLSLNIAGLRYWFGGTLAAAGLIGFIAGGVVAFAGDSLPLRSIEFPLGDVQDMAVDPSGNVVLALGFYGRIQVYDAQGRFQRGWSAEARGGSFTVAVDDSGLISSYASRRGSTLVFNPDGRVITTADSGSQRGHGETAIATADGSVLTLRHRFLWPTLVREKNGVVSVLVTGPWYLRPFTGPVPTWLLMMVGVLVSARKRRLGRPTEAARRSG